MTGEEQKNPYLLLNFWDFMLMSTLMVVFFPWSLIFCLYMYGWENTKLILAALIHDAIKTVIAIIAGILLIAAVIFLLISVF